MLYHTSVIKCLNQDVRTLSKSQRNERYLVRKSNLKLMYIRAKSVSDLQILMKHVFLLSLIIYLK